MYERATTLPPLRESGLPQLATRPRGRDQAESRQGEHRADRDVLEPTVSVLPQRPADHEPAPHEPEAEDPLSFADVFESMLFRRDMSQSKAGRLCGLNHSYINRLCLGGRKPSPEGVAAICEGLELSRLERFRLYVSAGFVPPDMPPAWLTAGELMVAIEEGGGQ